MAMLIQNQLEQTSTVINKIPEPIQEYLPPLPKETLPLPNNGNGNNFFGISTGLIIGIAVLYFIFKG